MNIPGFWSWSPAMFTAGVLLGGLAGWKVTERYARAWVIRYHQWRDRRERRPAR